MTVLLCHLELKYMQNNPILSTLMLNLSQSLSASYPHRVKLQILKKPDEGRGWEVSCQCAT